MEAQHNRYYTSLRQHDLTTFYQQVRKSHLENVWTRLLENAMMEILFCGEEKKLAKLSKTSTSWSKLPQSLSDDCTGHYLPVPAKGESMFPFTTGKHAENNVYAALLTKYIVLASKSIPIESAVKEGNYFLHETKKLCKLEHPNIVKIYDTSYNASTSLLVCAAMEKVEGISLKEILTNKRLLYPKQALKTILGVVCALEYGWQKGCGHFYLDPENIIIEHRNKRVKLVSYGLDPILAKIDVGAQFGAQEYTYLSPEAIEQKLLDHRSDIYSVGAILYHMLTGYTPYYDVCSNQAEVHEAKVNGRTPSPISELAPYLDHSIIEIANKAIALDPEKRYQTWAEIKHDIEDILAKKYK